MSDDMKVSVPEGRSGDWEVKKFKVTESASRFEALRASMHGSSRFPYPGTYTGLYQNGNIIMSDTRDEINDHIWMIHIAAGSILINGLGLGVVIQACLEKPEVQHATVLEISPDVVALVAPHYQQRYGDRLTIIQADAFTWKPPKGTRFDAVWHDIWSTLNTDNLEEMKTLHRRFGRYTYRQGSWCRELLEYNLRRGR